MKKLYALLSVLLLCCIGPAHGQQISVRGVVVDEQGSPLPGANVVLKGSTQGTITDVQGVYTIDAPGDASLVISFIGYITEEVQIRNRTEINVTLRENASVLKDVVVVGYGVKEKENITTAITSVSAEDIQKMPVVSFDQALQGRAPGVQVVKNTGAPGGGVSIRIRGTGSINGGQEPLYIIDGVPMTNSGTGSFQAPGVQGGGNYAGNEVINGLAGVNMEDIESIDVLKDAASASIYGSRAANGVVIITTKRGKEGTPRINFNTYYGVQHLRKRYELLNAQQYTAMVNQAILRTGNEIPYKETPATDTDWQDEIFQTAPMFNSNLSVSGGTNRTGYLFSLNYFDQEGIVINSGFDRYSFRANFDQKVTDKIKIGTSAMISRSTNKRLRNAGGANFFDAYNGNSVYGPSIISAALVANPALPVYDENGLFARDTLSTYVNPVAQAATANLVSNTQLVVGNVFAEIEPLRNLRLRSSWSTTLRNEVENFVFTALNGLPGGGRLQFNNYNEVLWTSENYLTYDFNIGENIEADLLAGFSVQEFSNRGTNVDVTGVTVGSYYDVAAGTNFLPYSTGGGNWGMVSYFGRAQLNFFDKYLFESTMRADGSSRFGPNRQYGYFPSASVAWKISEEDFMQGQSVISDAKLRASWGITGNDQIDPWGWRASAVLLNSQYIGYKPITPINIVNEDYSWESSIQTDIGLSFGILNSRIQFTADYYVKTSEDLLNRVPIPRTSGFSSAWRNVGTIENRGFELSVAADVLNKGDLNWSSSFNISFNKNKVVSTFTGGDIVTGNWGYSSVAREGEEISFQLFRIDRSQPVEEVVENNQTIAKWNVLDGPIQIVGSPLPDHFGGLNNNVKYKNFDVNIFFQWSYGNMIINNTRGEIQNNGKPDLSFVGPNLSAEALGRWVRPGDQSTATFPLVDYRNTSGLSFPTDVNLEDGSYLRLKTLAIGYTIPADALSRFKIQSARIYCSSNNLLTFTRYSGYDPEVNASGGVGGVSSNIGIGYDNGTYPQARSIVVGVNLNF